MEESAPRSCDKFNKLNTINLLCDDKGSFRTTNGRHCVTIWSCRLRVCMCVRCGVRPIRIELISDKLPHVKLLSTHGFYLLERVVSFTTLIKCSHGLSLTQARVCQRWNPIECRWNLSVCRVLRVDQMHGDMSFLRARISNREMRVATGLGNCSANKHTRANNQMCTYRARRERVAVTPSFNYDFIHIFRSKINRLDRPKWNFQFVITHSFQNIATTIAGSVYCWLPYIHGMLCTFICICIYCVYNFVFFFIVLTK